MNDYIELKLSKEVNDANLKQGLTLSIITFIILIVLFFVFKYISLLCIIILLLYPIRIIRNYYRNSKTTIKISNNDIHVIVGKKDKVYYFSSLIKYYIYNQSRLYLVFNDKSVLIISMFYENIDKVINLLDDKNINKAIIKSVNPKELNNIVLNDNEVILRTTFSTNNHDQTDSPFLLFDDCLRIEGSNRSYIITKGDYNIKLFSKRLFIRPKLWEEINYNVFENLEIVIKHRSYILFKNVSLEIKKAIILTAEEQKAIDKKAYNFTSCVIIVCAFIFLYILYRMFTSQ